jgi:thioredoxin-like negative regulator of GroEL
MGFFNKPKPYDRARLLAAISKAQARGKFRKALALYKEILQVEPNNPDLHRKVAPLLARTGRPQEAWSSFRIAADSFARGGWADKAIGVYREAVQLLPREAGAWIAIAEIQVDQNRSSEAVKTLLQGRANIRSRRQRADAIRLLARVRQLQPDHVEAGLDLARLLRKTGNRRGAGRLLRELTRFCHRRQLVRVRAAQLRLLPTPAALYRWLRARLRGY